MLFREAAVAASSGGHLDASLGGALVGIESFVNHLRLLLIRQTLGLGLAGSKSLVSKLTQNS